VKKEYTAIIIEPREHKALSFVLENFLENLSDDWTIIVFHGNKNELFVKKIISEDLKKHTARIVLYNLNVDNLTLGDYNNLLVDPLFYNNIPTETFLIFQTDTVICDNFNNTVDDYLDYDYVGAPWPWSEQGGNGGLSLRKKSKMLEIIKKCPYDGVMPEDVYFSSSCIKTKFPDKSHSKFFSNEQIYTSYSFGTHKPWNHLQKTELDQKITKCHPLQKLIELNR
jgi:hypothetical protein